MKKYVVICFLYFMLAPANSQSYSLKQNKVMVSECDNPRNGFVLTGKTIQKSANNDKFILDVTGKLFYWNDSKGNSKNQIYNFQSKVANSRNQYVFNTTSNAIRITTNQNKEAVIEIICLINNDWYCLSYLCTVR